MVIQYIISHRPAPRFGVDVIASNPVMHWGPCPLNAADKYQLSLGVPFDKPALK